MAEGMLDAGAEFAERLVVLGNEKLRIIAEATGAAIFADDAAAAAAFDDGVHLAGRIGKRRSADVVGLALLGRQRGQLREQSLVVRRIVPLLAGIARGVDAGPTAQSRQHQAAVLAEHPL